MKKILKAVMAAAITASLAGCSVNAEDNTKPAETEKDTSATREKTLSFSSEETGKEETVYIFTDSSGNQQKVIVSDRLHTGGKSGAVQDHSNLENIVNVSGDETFTQSTNGDITWQSDGKDISYQGTSSEEIPVSVKATYYLDDKEVSPEDIAGASGHIKIRYDYTNNLTKQVTVNGKTETVHVPFAMITGLILPESFTNVTVENGKCIQYDSNSLVYGIAFPGLKESLQLADDNDLASDIELPEYVEVEADTTDFSIDMAMTYASANVLNDIGTEDFDLDDLDNSISDLDDAAVQLLDGTKSLKDGTQSLYEGAQTLSDGASSLANGASQLANGASSAYAGAETLTNGLATLSSNSSALNSGAMQIAQGILDTANQQLKTNDLTKDLPDLTLSNYATVLGGAIGKDKLRAAALQQVEAQTGQDETTTKALLYMAAIHSTGNTTADLQTQAQRALNAQAIQQATASYTGREAALNSPAVQTVLAAYKQSLLQNITIPAATADQMNQVYATIASTVKSAAQGQLNSLSDDQVNAIAAYALNNAGTANITTDTITQALGQLLPALQNQETAAAILSTDYKTSTAYQAFANSMYQQAYTQQYTQTVSNMDNSAIYDQIAARINQNGNYDDATIAKLIGYTCDHYDQTKDLTAQLTENASTLSDAVSVAAEIANASTAEGEEKINGALDVLINGNASVAEGLQQLDTLEKSLDGVSSFIEGLKSYTAGVDSAYAGSVQLTNGLQTLNEGASTLSNGASQLKDGANTLLNGASELNSGAQTLMDGMQQFYDEGIKKITDLFGSDLADVADRAQALMDAGADYTTYGGALDDENNSVRFIFKLQSITSDSDNN